MSAEERRTQIVAVAARAFAGGGLHGTSTEKIAADAGISQPYLFRLFPTKVDLFLACVGRCFERVRATFAAAAEGLVGEEALVAMGQAYFELLGDPDLLRLQLHAYASAAAEGGPIRDLVRRGFLDLVDEVQERTGLGDDEIQQFFSTGMLINVVASFTERTADLLKAKQECYLLRVLRQPTA